jgi:hypothetical protein
MLVQRADAAAVMHGLESEMLYSSAQNELYALLGISFLLALILVGILAKIYEKSISKYHLLT